MIKLTGQEAYEWSLAYFPGEQHPSWDNLSQEEQTEYEQAARETNALLNESVVYRATSLEEHLKQIERHTVPGQRYDTRLVTDDGKLMYYGEYVRTENPFK